MLNRSGLSCRQVMRWSDMLWIAVERYDVLKWAVVPPRHAMWCYGLESRGVMLCSESMSSCVVPCLGVVCVDAECCGVSGCTGAWRRREMECSGRRWAGLVCRRGLQCGVVN